MTILFRAVDSNYRGKPCGWSWWTPCRDWAENYGAAIIERPAVGLHLLTLPLDALDAREALIDGGVDVSDIKFSAEEEPEWEIQMVLAHPRYGRALSTAVAAAGYDGVMHPDHIEGVGTGAAVALVE